MNAWLLLGGHRVPTMRDSPNSPISTRCNKYSLVPLSLRFTSQAAKHKLVADLARLLLRDPQPIPQPIHSPSTAMATNDRFDYSAIDSDSDWESDGLDEVVRSFQRVPYTKPAAGPSLISIEIAQGGMTPGNGGTLPTHPLGHGRRILRRSGRATAKSLPLSDSELSTFLSEISLTDSQANSTDSLGASATTASTSQSNSSQSNSNPDEGCLMVMTRRPCRQPPIGSRFHTKFPTQPENTPVTPFNSPRANRQAMLKKELPCSLRQNMLWERSLKTATADAVLRRRHTTPNVPRLNQRRRVSRTNPNRSFHDLQMLRKGYNDKGW